jgi:NAD+ synthase (glutamine-hydrolysing)
MKKLRIALCRFNPTVGDISGNTEKIIQRLRAANEYNPDITAFPELAVTGYPPEDLLLKPHFVRDNIRAIERISAAIGDSIAIAGFVDRADDHIYNAAAIMRERSVVDIYRKIHLPNYGVFDEVRYFRPGERCPVYTAGDIRFGVNICEDIWIKNGPAAAQASGGADIIINISASPYHIGKYEERTEMLTKTARDNNVAIAYLNMTGGQDELVFDGHTLVINNEGELIVEAKRFEEDDVIIDIVIPHRYACGAPSNDLKIEDVTICRQFNQRNKPPLPDKPLMQLSKTDRKSDCGDIYNALVMGTRDYVNKNGFNKACIGLSGGVDSALVAAIAADALGRDNVAGIFMPSPFTSAESRVDACELARNLGIELMEIPISKVYNSYLDTLKPQFEKRPAGIAEENIQARIRGNILMGMSNKFGWLVLTTGNKSEMSVGYATLYGDMAGGFAPIKDVPKTLVYRLCKWRNMQAPAIPERIITKEPTAELKPGQKDTDSLPPYEILDPILKAYIEDSRNYEEIVALGFDADLIKKVIGMVDRSEYKRRQSPPGSKITPLAFGRDRRFPITNKYRSC